MSSLKSAKNKALALQVAGILLKAQAVLTKIDLAVKDNHVEETDAAISSAVEHLTQFAQDR